MAGSDHGMTAGVHSVWLLGSTTSASRGSTKNVCSPICPGGESERQRWSAWARDEEGGREGRREAREAHRQSEVELGVARDGPDTVDEREVETVRAEHLVGDVGGEGWRGEAPRAVSAE